MSTRDIATGANAALKAESGTKYCHCVEMKFGSTVRARSGDPSTPDTLVAWTGRGDLTQLRVYTSIDGGDTWQRVERNGDPIPGLPIGAPTTNRTVRARIVFANGAPGVVVDSFTLRVVHEDGTIRERVETGANLATGTLYACGYSASVGGLVTFPDVSLRFQGDRGGITNANATPHDADGNRSGLHLSHGSLITRYAGGVIEQQLDEENRLRNAACAFEGWFYPEKTTGVLVGCTYRDLDDPSRDTGTGILLELVESVPGESARLQFTTVEPFAGSRSGDPAAHGLSSGAGSVPLNRWSHVAFTYDGFWGSLLLNGAIVARNAFVARAVGRRTPSGAFIKFGIPLPSNGPWAFGRHPVSARNQGGTATSFQGRLTEWRLYNRRITVGAVTQRMFRRLSAAEVAIMVEQDGLIAYLPMNESTGRFAFDLAGSSLHFPWNQQQVGSTREPFKLAWVADASKVWRGFSIDRREVLPGIFEDGDRHPGRETPPLSVDADGDVLRLCDSKRNVTFDGKTFIGVGGLGSVSAIQEPGDLVPTGVQLGISGLLPQHLSIALQARYLDRPVTVWQVTWDADDVQQEEFLLFKGRADEMNIALGAQGAVEVSARTVLSNWRRPVNRRWNDEAHRAIYPDDYGFRDVADMVDRQVWWPSLSADESATPEDA